MVSRLLLVGATDTTTTTTKQNINVKNFELLVVGDSVHCANACVVGSHSKRNLAHAHLFHS